MRWLLSLVHTLANGYTLAIPTAAQVYVDGHLEVSDTGRSTVVDVTETFPLESMAWYSSSGHERKRVYRFKSVSV